jgi:hypothetical protein
MFFRPSRHKSLPPIKTGDPGNTPLERQPAQRSRYRLCAVAAIAPIEVSLHAQLPIQQGKISSRQSLISSKSRPPCGSRNCLIGQEGSSENRRHGDQACAVYSFLLSFVVTACYCIRPDTAKKHSNGHGVKPLQRRKPAGAISANDRIKANSGNLLSHFSRGTSQSPFCMWIMDRAPSLQPLALRGRT